MTDAEAAPDLLPADHADLVRAIDALERPSLAARLADYAGQPVNRLMRFMPRVASPALKRAVAAALDRCLRAAIQSLDDDPSPASPSWLPTAITGVTGGLSGVFGIAALAVELPVTTTVMLRAIADVARQQGEDLGTVEARLACLEVFALGGSRPAGIDELGYFSTRAVLAKLSGDAASFLLRRGVADASAPALTRFVAEIAARYGLVVSERAAAGAVPILGAVTGAAINVVFMDHFLRVARGHFTIRRLERQYGAPAVRRRYDALAPRERSAGTRPRLLKR